MLPLPEAFTFDYFGSDVVYGRGCVAGLDASLAARGLERALVVTGTNVSANDAVVTPVEEGLGEPGADSGGDRGGAAERVVTAGGARPRSFRRRCSTARDAQYRMGSSTAM